MAWKKSSWIQKLEGLCNIRFLYVMWIYGCHLSCYVSVRLGWFLSSVVTRLLSFQREVFIIYGWEMRVKDIVTPFSSLNCLRYLSRKLGVLAWCYVLTFRNLPNIKGSRCVIITQQAGYLFVHAIGFCSWASLCDVKLECPMVLLDLLIKLSLLGP